MLRKYIKSFNLSQKSYGGVHRSSLISARTKASRKYIMKRRSSNIKRSILIFFTILFLGFVIYIIFFSSVFKIKNIEINKLIDYQLMSNEEIKGSLGNLINQSNNNLIFLKSAVWQKGIIDDSRLESLSIRKKWPNSIEINLQEAQPVAILRILGDNQPYYLNKQGGVIKASLNAISAELENDLSPIFYDQSKTNTKNELYVNFLEKLLVFVQSDVLLRNDIHIQRVNLNNIGDIFDAQIVIKEGWQIFINSEVDLEEQLISLLQILDEEIEDRNNLEYIDLRFGAKMFYKLK